MIAPPYFLLDDDELTRHFASAANAADPLPFYVYEFVGRSGYAIPLAVVTRVRESAPKRRRHEGLGLAVQCGRALSRARVGCLHRVGATALQGMGAGAVGSVSGLAAAFPELTASLVHQRSEAAHTQVCRLRDELAGIPFHAALKQVLVARDVLISPDVRAPRAGSPTPRGCGCCRSSGNCRARASSASPAAGCAGAQGLAARTRTCRRARSPHSGPGRDRRSSSRADDTTSSGVRRSITKASSTTSPSSTTTIGTPSITSSSRATGSRRTTWSRPAARSCRP